MSLYDKLQQANLPVIWASETQATFSRSLGDHERKRKAEKLKKNIAIKRSALEILQSLQGKKPEEMTKDERPLYDRAIGQLLGLLDVESMVKVD